MEKSIEQIAAETKWLDEAKAYSDSRGWSHLFDFSVIDEYEEYYRKGISPEESVDDMITDTEYEGD
jgi:hypothetical protein